MVITALGIEGGGEFTYTEAPWLWKHGDTYYLGYAVKFPEQLAYATAPSATGPWTFGGMIQDYVPNSNTTHPAMIEVNGASYMFYHNGALPQGGEYRRSVCVDRLTYASDGSIALIPQTHQPYPGKRLESFNFRIWYARPAMEGGQHIVRFWDPSYWVWPFHEMLWVEEPGLGDAREGFVSLRNYGTGTYAYDNGPGAPLLMRPLPLYPTADFKARATFRKVAGLAAPADPAWTSYQSYDGTRYVRHWGWVLQVQPIDVNDPGAQGDATFSLHE